MKSKGKVQKKEGPLECIACGAKPPHQHEEPYEGHRSDCSLVATWRRSAALNDR